MNPEFQLIKSLQLKEASDHYTILLLKEGSNLCQSLDVHVRAYGIFPLCSLFQIPYHNEWSYGGDQIEIPKHKEALQ